MGATTIGILFDADAIDLLSADIFCLKSVGTC
jgi:hypothetical protein